MDQSIHVRHLYWQPDLSREFTCRCHNFLEIDYIYKTNATISPFCTSYALHVRTKLFQLHLIYGWSTFWWLCLDDKQGWRDSSATPEGSFSRLRLCTDLGNFRIMTGRSNHHSPISHRNQHNDPLSKEFYLFHRGNLEVVHGSLEEYFPCAYGIWVYNALEAAF